LLPRTQIAPEFLKSELRRLGGKVTEVIAYRTLANLKERKKLMGWLRDEEIDYALFTSSSTAQYFSDAVTPAVRKILKLKAVSIGPVTSRTLRQKGLRPFAEAKKHTIDGMIQSLIRLARNNKRK
jgi:uroporphyrinogen-III synthase